LVIHEVDQADDFRDGHFPFTLCLLWTHLWHLRHHYHLLPTRFHA